MDDCRESDLYELLVTAKLEDALYLTGVMILNNKVSDLEDTWIHACSGNELKGAMPSAWKWRDIIHDTYEIVKSEAFKIEDALLLTTKLCIFYKELLSKENGMSGGRKPMVHIKHLRNVIQEDFPEGSMLSHAGIRCYRRVLPEDPEELLFSHRILSGLSRLWTEKHYEKSRDALEYLSRRRLSIQLPDLSWPSPTPEDANCFLWFLWGAALCFFQNMEAVHKMFFLFKREARKTRRQQRLGLLWHIGYILGGVDGSPWTAEENKWLSYIRENANDLWGQIRDAHKELKDTERVLKKASGHASVTESLDDIFQYIPRTGEEHTPPEETPYQPAHLYDHVDLSRERKIKIVGLKSGKESPTNAALVRKIE
jgi:hypothetical protein